MAVWEEWKVVRKQAQAPVTQIRMKLQLLHTNLVKSAPTSNRPTLSRLSHPKDDPNHNAEDSAALDLLSCESISYEMRQNIPGVTYMKDGCEGWTPVVSRNRRRKKLKQQPISSDDSDSELDVRGAREVSYQERDGVPYLYVCRGCTSRNVKWTPIAPSPIAFRTRGRIKNSHDVI